MRSPPSGCGTSATARCARCRASSSCSAVTGSPITSWPDSRGADLDPGTPRPGGRHGAEHVGTGDVRGRQPRARGRDRGRGGAERPARRGPDRSPTWPTGRAGRQLPVPVKVAGPLLWISPNAVSPASPKPPRGQFVLRSAAFAGRAAGGAPGRAPAPVLPRSPRARTERRARRPMGSSRRSRGRTSCGDCAP